MSDPSPAERRDELERLHELARLQFSVDHAPEAVFWMSKDGSFAYVNHRACSSLGYTREELARLRLWDIDPDYPRERWAQQWEAMRERGQNTFETRHRRKDGTLVPVEVSAFHMAFEGFEHHVAFVRDVSARKAEAAERERLAEQLNQARKMESIGRLAGGVAHDFNNMLSVILGYAELLRERLGAHHEAGEDLREIEAAALRSRDLTRQLLAFSRRQAAAPRVLCLDDVIAGLARTLDRLLGDDVEVRVRLPEEGSWPVRIDPSQLDQVLMNLAVNARDAMPHGGALTLETGNVTLDEAWCRAHLGVAPGRYVRLAVSDQGVGMDAGTLAHVFEPFFTTKAPGHGTGLGLATVYGVVKQNGGVVDVRSEVGRGSRFEVYLPAAAGRAEPRPPAGAQPPAKGHGRVLLVEDEDSVRRLTARMLESLGYAVEAVRTPAEALQRAAASRELALLLTDVTMPGMNGVELRDALAASRPGLKVVFMSGYTDHAGVAPGSGAHFLQKPFELSELARVMRQALGEE